MMNKLILTLGFAIASYASFAQNTFPGTGNVGIGTISPLYKLHTVTTGNTNYVSSFLYGDYYGTMVGVNTTSPNYYAFNVASGIAANSSGGNSIFTVRADGNVGIGTTSPISPLQVDDATVDDNNIIISNQRNGYAAGGKNMLAFTQGTAASTINGKIGFDYNTTTMQIVNGSTVGLSVNSSGFVGIGTTTPQEALSVNGNIRSREVKVETANWPDYVFRPTYNLPFLKEVKAYIDQNHHLPDMPSEAEVAKNGINLGEMVKLQTKKIEELTLYLIKQNEQLAKQNEQLMKQNDQIAKQRNINKSLQEQINQLAKRRYF